MKIRDVHATLNGNDEVIEIESKGIEILADDGRPLFEIRQSGNVLEIDSGMVCKHGGKMYDQLYSIEPVAGNLVRIVKKERKP